MAVTNQHGGVDLTVSVTGVKQALRELRQVDEDMYWQSIKKMKDAASDIVSAIDGGFPPNAGAGIPTGFQHNGRTGWANVKPTEVKYGGKQPARWKRDQVWPLIRIRIVDAPRMIFDMAGAKSSNPLSRNLDKSYGPASRAVWRVSEATRRRANKAITDAIREAVAHTNRKLSVIRSAA